jgi:hypothetical protein
MIHLVLVALGAAAGSAVFVRAWQHRWDWRRILTVNVVVCACAGAVAGALDFMSRESVVLSFLGYGLLATAAPFAATLLPLAPVRDNADAWRLVRRTAGRLTLHSLLCATAASATYMVIAGSFFYLRATH